MTNKFIIFFGACAAAIGVSCISRFEDTREVVPLTVTKDRVESASKSGKEHFSHIKKVFEKNCFKCHGALNKAGKKVIKGELDLTEHLKKGEFADSAVLEKSFKLILANKMPPEDARPLKEENKRKLLNDLSKYGQIKKDRTELKSSVAKISKQQLTAKLEVLLNTNLSFLNPLERVPDSLRVDRAMTDRLIDSYYLSEYVSAVDEIVEKAFSLTDAPPTLIDENFEQPLFYTQKKWGKIIRRNGNAENIIWYGGQNTENNGILSIPQLFKSGVPYSGFYDLEITAKAENRGQLPDEVTGIDSSVPLRLGILTGLSKKAGKYKPQYWHEPNEQYLAEFDLPDDEFKSFHVRVWLEKDYYPRFVYMNGALLQHKIIPRLEKYLNKKAPHEAGWSMFISESKAQRILLKSVKFKSAPLPTDNYEIVFGQNNNSTSFEGKITKFAERAYGRTLSVGEREKILQRIEDFFVNKHHTVREKYKFAAKLILSSPKMLYQVIDSQHESFNDYLSYHLINQKHSLKEGLLDSTELIERLLSMPEAQYFSRSFLDFWLHINKSLSINPFVRDPYYRTYYISRIKESSMAETYLTFLYMLRNDRSALELLNADYKLVNSTLQKHYDLSASRLHDIPNMYSEELNLYSGQAESSSFKLVNKANVGGFLTQASILNLTSDEVATNPILRGVWVMKDFLGIPLKAPPADVPAFEPDLRSAKSVREQLEVHKANKACAVCHVDMDPLGLALESYDNIGALRETYTNGRKITVQEEIFGSDVASIDDLKRTLVDTKADIFVMHISAKMLEFFLKRKIQTDEYLELYDRINILKKEGYPMRSLLMAVLGHSSFKQEH